MGRYRERSRSRSRSYRSHRSRTPPPRRDYDGCSHRDRRSVRDRRSPGPSGLLVRNISLSARDPTGTELWRRCDSEKPEDLRIPFERFGPVKDVYLPKNYYTGEPRGFGFVKFRNGEDAAEAKYHLNHTVIGGREIALVFAAENRKTPLEMRKTGRLSRYGGSRRPSPPRSPRRRYHSYSCSPSSARHDSREHRARDYYSSSRSRSISRSVSPRDDKVSNRKSTSPKRNGRSPFDKGQRGSDRRSPSVRDSDLSPRHDNYSPYNERDSELKHIPSAREDDQNLSKSLPRSHYRSRSRSPSYSR